jgi:hypothetical protein
VAAVVKRFGPAMLPIIERRLAVAAGVAAAIIVALLLAARLLH